MAIAASIETEMEMEMEMESSTYRFGVHLGVPERVRSWTWLVQFRVGAFMSLGVGRWFFEVVKKKERKIMRNEIRRELTKKKKKDKKRRNMNKKSERNPNQQLVNRGLALHWTGDDDPDRVLI